MKNKEPKKVRLSTVVLLFIILILIVALVLMYMYYNKDAKNEVATNTNKPEPMNTTNNTNVEESDRKELNINSSLVKEVYDYIPAIDEDLYDENPITLPNAYQTKKVTYDDLNSKLLLANAFFKSNKDMSEDIYMNDIEAEKVTDFALKYYNEEIEPVSFTMGAISLIYKNGMYGFANGGYTDTYANHISNIEEAYEENDELYIIDNYIMYISKSGDIQQGDESENFEIYDSSERKKIVAEDEIENRDNIDDIDEYINKKFSTKAKKYKHTFKKNDDGEYYWYSSEPYNEEE